MKQIKTYLSRMLVVLVVTFPWANAEALETFQQAGVISSVNASTVNIHNHKTDFRIRLDTEIRIPNIAKPQMSDFKVGHGVYLRGTILNGAYYVDQIVYMPKIPG